MRTYVSSVKAWGRSLVLTLIATIGGSIAVRTVQGADPQELDFFKAIQEGKIQVDLIPKDAKEAQLIIRNNGDQPLKIRAPEAFAGVPVLAQFQPGGAGGGVGGGGLGGNQGVGGGLGGGGQFGGGGGGFMNIAPEKVQKIKVATVCLEHGKLDPNPRVKYQIVPAESFTQKPEVIELCKMLGRGEIDQVSAQAVAWHLQDGLTWEQLAAKDRVRLRNGYTEKWFGPSHLAAAVKATAEAKRRAAEAPAIASPGESQSAAKQ